MPITPPSGNKVKFMSAFQGNQAHRGQGDC